MSPLAEGRELKYESDANNIVAIMSPLAEGRELKFHFNEPIPPLRASPLAEGRELKYGCHTVVDRALQVAPRGGA